MPEICAYNLELTAEEKMFRRTRIGSSEIAVLLGVDKWKFQTPADIVDRILHPDKPRKPLTSQAAKDGKRLEPTLRQFYADETGHTVRHAPPKIINDHLADNSDGLVYDGDTFLGPLEIKTTQIFSDWKHGVPIYYQPQCQLHMMAWNAPKCFTMMWGRTGTPEVIYELDADPIMQEVILYRAKELFDNYIKKGVLPPIDLSAAWKERLSETPSRKEKKIEATPETDALVRQFRNLQVAAKEAEENFEIKKRELQMAIGDAERLVGDDYEVAYKTQMPRRSINYRAIVNALGPDKSVIDENTTTASNGIRPLRAKFFKNAE